MAVAAQIFPFAPEHVSSDDRQSIGTILRSVSPSKIACEVAQLVEQSRPDPLRTYDQIPMRARDLARQATLVAPSLADLEVVFVGDHDSTSLMLGLLGAVGEAALPARMTVLDFDERLLSRLEGFAARHGFSDILDVRLYNVFDPLPSDLVGCADAFYTNPPYGSRNDGASVRLFLARALESVRTLSDAAGPEEPFGYALLPHDGSRSWTRSAMLATQRFMCEHGWMVGEKANGLHGYALDDDPTLTSALVRFDGASYTEKCYADLFSRGRRVAFDEVPDFYGGSVAAPYPRYIRDDETAEDWTASTSPLLP